MAKRDDYDREHMYTRPGLIFKGLFIVLVFIGLSIFISSIIFAFVRPGYPLLPVLSLRVLGWALFLVFLLWIFFWLITWPWRRTHRHYRRDYLGEKEIARKRYASGEITRKQYLEIIKDLKDTED